MRIALPVMLLVASLGFAQDNPTKLFKDKSENTDTRLGKPKNLNDYFPFAVPATKESWNTRKAELREQILVGLGLWPMPEKTPLNAVVHGKMDRDGYTVEKVYFASMPGHYVTGNLYRPTSKVAGKRPAVLTGHGHWPPEGPKGGRFYDAGDAKVKTELTTKAEQTEEGARHPLQARCAQLARMGFVVFHYDMVGYADSQAIKHRTGFTDAQAELRSQSFMGLQTWNSIRALDFLTSLPDVDDKKIGVTGASGGGTQTFLLCALDDRPAAAFPAVMVSTAMQGGCVCENCSYLRVGTGNVEIAGMFAPKPLAMSGANDWTKEIETKGLPELKALYKMLGAEDKVAGKCWPEFGHNYNQVAREFMYSWFNQHLLGGTGPVKELPFKPFTGKELSVYDDLHPRPKDELGAEELRKTMTAAADKQLAALTPKDAASLAEFRKVAGTSLKAMIGETLPGPQSIEKKQVAAAAKIPSGMFALVAFGRKGQGDKVPMLMAIKDDKTIPETVVIWVSPEGKSSLLQKGELHPAAKKLLDAGYGIMAPDVFQTGELKGDKPMPVDPAFAGFTYGYNRSVFANRVHDILTTVRMARDIEKVKNVHIIGWDGAGPWVVAARALCGDAVQKTVADLNQFRFENITSTQDENLLPGAVKLGGLPAMLALCAPHAVFAHNHQGTHTGELPKAAYDTASAKDALTRKPEKATPDEVAAYLLGK
ncbi:acetylxylan esterase [Zavarzinella formosa]|uniref:acetylxylan esterase n=1 Tax=Zavarzinella formosa TaxID=360055 RepID=UPI0002E514D0|nr:acetylxylan esterase [Zavarzinella formosa]